MLIAGNWKMNGDPRDLSEFTRMVARAPEVRSAVTLVVCPPAVMLQKSVERATVSPLTVGAQDCHFAASGAHTGDLSAEMIASCGAEYVIVGHSERRTDHGETDEIVSRKALAAQRAGLTAIVCIGETEAQRDAGEADQVVTNQLNGSIADAVDPGRLVIAYEPVWAIGTGRTPSTADVAAIHGSIRRWLDDRFGTVAGVPVLYGGSVKPGNAHELLAVENVDGALVGGASLKADDFIAIALAATAVLEARA